MISYEEIPDGYDFNTIFPTWIIGFCPDTGSFFVTNKRFFFYEFEKEFKSENEGIEFFENNLSLFYNIQNRMLEYPPSFLKNKVWLDNTEKHYFV